MEHTNCICQNCKDQCKIYVNKIENLFNSLQSFSNKVTFVREYIDVALCTKSMGNLFVICGIFDKLKLHISNEQDRLEYASLNIDMEMLYSAFQDYVSPATIMQIFCYRLRMCDYKNKNKRTLLDENMEVIE